MRIPELNYALCGSAIGGLRHFFVVAADDILSIPDALNYELPMPILLAPGAQLIQLEFPEDGAEFSENSAESDHGLFYKQKITLSLPKDSPEISSWSNTLGKVKYAVVIYCDNNGFWKIVGSQDFPLSFSSETDTGKAAGSKYAHTFIWNGESIDKSFFYPALEVETVPTDNPAGSGEPVTIVDGLGRTLATVLPGGRFQINSGFSYGFRILN